MDSQSVTSPGTITKTRLMWESDCQPEVRAAIVAWFERHGLPLPRLLTDDRGRGWVEVDHTRHTIEWPHGECRGCHPAGTGYTEKVWPGCQPVTTTEQGEADPRPLPFSDQSHVIEDAHWNESGWQISRTRTI